MGRLLCLLGFHKFREWMRYETYSDERTAVERVIKICERCANSIEYYDTGE